jgi:Bacterial mobilisation protein (MobC)
MSFCLGQKVSLGAGGNGPQTPGRMRSAKEKRKMGRPRTSEPRCHQLNLSLTARELKSIKCRAAALGMRPVHFGRAMLLDKNKQPPSNPETNHSNIDRLVYGQLVRLGNNLNQIVRRLHQTGDPLPADLEPLLNDIRAILARRVSP